MIYATLRALSAALAFGMSSQLPGIAVIALALLWSLVAILVAPLSFEFLWAPLFFEVAFGLWMGLAASLPVVAARLGAAMGEERLHAPFSALGALFAGTILFAAGLDHVLIRAFADSFALVPLGQAHLAIKGPASVGGLLQITLLFSLRVGSTAIVALLLFDLGNALLARLFPGMLPQIPREPVRVLGLMVSLGAISYVILEAAQHALLLM